MLRIKYAKLAAVQLSILIILIAAACGGGEKAATPVAPLDADPISEQAYQPIIVSTDLSMGTTRFIVALLDSEGKPVVDAPLDFRIFKLEDGGDLETLKAEMTPRPIAIQRNFTHVHEDGKTETHETGEIGVYVANVDFDLPGEWSVEINGVVDGEPIEAVRQSFGIRERSFSLGVGEPAPRSIQTILNDVDDIFEIDTSNPPTPHMHDMTIADAVTSGRPTVIVFSTPGFCRTRLCGPTKDMVDQLYEKFRDQANFVHVEPYDLEKARADDTLLIQPFITDEWGLQTEPWIFMVDGQGNIASKFEAFVSIDELDSELAGLLGSARPD